MTAGSPLYGCIEAGGTKFVVGVASGPDDVRDVARFPTTSPDETIGSVINWLRQQGPLAAVGIASFGPVELDGAAPNWGHITATTKPGWSHTPFAGRVADALGAPVGFDTDVNGAALAESLWGAGRGQRLSVYVTVGTGIGGGAIVDGQILRGLSHPEMGHVRLPRHPDDRDFAGACPFHGDCLEGLASGPAIMARWGKSLSDLPDDHPGHGIIAWYLAQFTVTLQSIMEPGRVIFGGGVMATPGLMDRMRAIADDLGSSYFRGKASEIIVPPGLGDRAGLLGGLALAMEVAR